MTQTRIVNMKTDGDGNVIHVEGYDVDATIAEMAALGCEIVDEDSDETDLTFFAPKETPAP